MGVGVEGWPLALRIAQHSSILPPRVPGYPGTGGKRRFPLPETSGTPAGKVLKGTGKERSRTRLLHWLRGVGWGPKVAKAGPRATIPNPFWCSVTHRPHKSRVTKASYG